MGAGLVCEEGAGLVLGMVDGVGLGKGLVF